MDVPGLQGSVSRGPGGGEQGKLVTGSWAAKAGLGVLTRQRSYWSSKKLMQLLIERGQRL